MTDTTPPARSRRARNMLLFVLAAAVAVFIALVLMARSGGGGSAVNQQALFNICFDSALSHLMDIGEASNSEYQIDIDGCNAWAAQTALSSSDIVAACLIPGEVQDKEDLENACLVDRGIDVPLLIIEPGD